MKLFSTTALGLALVLVASSGTIAPQAAFAAKPKAAPYKLSEPVRKALAAAQEAMKTNDTATAQARVDEAKAAMSTPDDRFLTYNQLYTIAQATKNNKAQVEAVDGMLQSGKVEAADQPKFYFALGQLAYASQDYAKAEQAFQQTIKLDANNQDAYALLAEAKFQQKKPAEAIGIIEQAAISADAKGAAIPDNWFQRGISMGSDAKLPDPVARLTRLWLKAYPTQLHWRDTLVLYRDLHPVDPEYNLDVMRLQRAAGALRGERDYVDMAEATYLRFPNEAKAVIDQGASAGVLNLAQSRSAKELQTLSAGKIAADKASLKKTATTGRSALGTADAYASYGDYASAIELYHKALTLGGVDANMINTRLGVALVMSGQKDEARKVLASITGPRADLAQYWLVFLDHPPTA